MPGPHEAEVHDMSPHVPINRSGMPDFACALNADEIIAFTRAAFVALRARDPRGMLAENYLCLRRLALDDALAGRVLRFHPRTPWRSENSGEIEYLPALIAAFRSLDDEITGIHRIALKPDGHNIGKRMLGVVHRAAVKDALAGVIYPITDMYDVLLMVARGYASLSFLYSAAEYINDLDVPTYIYHLGDFDPSGVNAGEKIEETLRVMAPDAEIYFQRIAVPPEQITEWNLPTRPTKASDTRSKGFGNISVELDAIDPNALRALVEETIEQHLPPDQFAVLKAAEQSEREVI